jgi:hypothetical protein
MRTETNTMKKSFIILLCLALLAACAPKEKTGSVSGPTDSAALTGEKENILVEPAGKIPIDTIVATYPNGKKLHLLVLEYYDSLPDKPIKDFEVRDAVTNESVFRSVSKRLVLGYETDPMKGEYDSMFVVPTYSISSKDPLTVDLNFIVNGELWVKYVGDVTYPFYESRPWNRLSFLHYTFQSADDKSIVQSSLRFTPRKCVVTETELMAQFNRVKSEGNLDTESGGELMKSSFICFVNRNNQYYEMITKEFKQAFGESDFPYNYYVYIVYLDRFIINLTSQ